jgi:hypothetical protein
MSETENSREISLFSLLLVMAQSWWLLVFGPIVAGLVGLGVSYGLPVAGYSEANLLLLIEHVFTRNKVAAIAANDDFCCPSANDSGYSAGPTARDLSKESDKT